MFEYGSWFVLGLEPIEICNLLTKKRWGKRVPNLIIQSHMVKMSASTTSRGGATCIH